MPRLAGASSLVCLVGSLLSFTGSAQAALAITAPNAGRGFVLSDFVTGFPGSAPMQPAGIAFASNHHVLVTDVDNSTLYALPSHADGQVVGPANVLTTYTSVPYSLAQVQIGGTWHFFGNGFGGFVELDPATGAVTRTLFGVAGLGAAPFPPGIAGPYAGHIFAGGTAIMWNIDPVAWTAVPYAASPTVVTDGMTFSPDGSLLYVVHLDSLFAINVATTGIA